MAKKHKFPDTLYVKKEVDGKSGYFVADESAGSHAFVGEKVRVGIYSLLEVVDIGTAVEMFSVGLREEMGSR